MERLEGAHVLGGEKGNNEKASERPDEADHARDDASQKSQSALEHFQKHADGRGEQRPLKNAPLAIPCRLKAVIQCRVAAGEAIRCDADKRNVEKYHYTVGSDVEKKNEGQHLLAEQLLLDSIVGNRSLRHEQEQAAAEYHHRGGQTENCRDNRQPHKLFVGLQDPKTLPKKIPASRDCPHGVSCMLVGPDYSPPILLTAQCP